MLLRYPCKLASARVSMRHLHDVTDSDGVSSCVCLQREVELLDRGLFSVRLVGCILAQLWASGDEGVQAHIAELLDLRGKGRDFVAALVRDHVASVGGEGAQELADRLERAAAIVEA